MNNTETTPLSLESLQEALSSLERLTVAAVQVELNTPVVILPPPSPGCVWQIYAKDGEVFAREIPAPA